MHYREALPKDVDGITSIHVVGGQQAYADILPAEYLEGVMPSEKSDLWRSRLSECIDRTKISVTVAEEANDLAGFACFLFDEEQVFGTYLHNIYVDKRYQRRGVASGLLAAGIESFHTSWREQLVHLLVFAKNAPARAFY
ncbi:MAG: GNAT family N-acetyltransferase [Devosia sp.]